MNIREMQYHFGIQLNQLDNALKLNSDSIQYWLNKAQIRLVKAKYEGLINGRGFEESQIRTDDLRVLLKKDVSLDTSYVGASDAIDGFYVDKITLPNDYWLLISQRSKIRYKFPSITFTVSENKRVSESYTEKIVFNRFSQSDDIYSLLKDPFNTTKVTSPLSDINEDNINIYTDKTFIVDKVIINYLRLPVEMNIVDETDSELPEHIHEEIVQLGVDLFLNSAQQLNQRPQAEQSVEDKQ